MVRVEDGEMTIRPLAGTRRRGATEDEDQAPRRRTAGRPEGAGRAHHAGRPRPQRRRPRRAVSAAVKLSDVMAVERYSHVMHITSNVTGQLQPGKTALDALRAGLPAARSQGRPKVRAMEIIDELEPHRRGPYGGAVGYIDFTGNMDTCIALRTLVIPERGADSGQGTEVRSQRSEVSGQKAGGKSQKSDIDDRSLTSPQPGHGRAGSPPHSSTLNSQPSTIFVQAGAGIVADSVPSAEYEETLNKARGMLKAIEVADRQVRQST